MTVSSFAATGLAKTCDLCRSAQAKPNHNFCDWCLAISQWQTTYGFYISPAQVEQDKLNNLRQLETLLLYSNF